MDHLDCRVKENAFSLLVHLPMKQNVFGQPHVVVVSAESFEHTALVSNICRRAAFFESQRRARHEILKLDEVTNQPAQASRSSISERTPYRGVFLFFVPLH